MNKGRDDAPGDQTIELLASAGEKITVLNPVGFPPKVQQEDDRTTA